MQKIGMGDRDRDRGSQILSACTHIHISEALIPMDYKEHGLIEDDEIMVNLIAKLPAGVEITIIMDGCCGGSAIQLPYISTVNTLGHPGSYSLARSNFQTLIMVIKCQTGVSNKAFSSFSEATFWSRLCR